MSLAELGWAQGHRVCLLKCWGLCQVQLWLCPDFSVSWIPIFMSCTKLSVCVMHSVEWVEQIHFADIWIISHFVFWFRSDSIKIHVCLSPPAHHNTQQFQYVPLERIKLAPCNPGVNPASVTPFLWDGKHEPCHPVFYCFVWRMAFTSCAALLWTSLRFWGHWFTVPRDVAH